MGFHHQNYFYFMELLPPANEVWGKVICSQRGGHSVHRWGGVVCIQWVCLTALFTKPLAEPFLALPGTIPEKP